MTKIAAVVALAAAGNLAIVTPAAASGAGWVTQFLDNVYQQTVKQLMTQMGLGVEAAVTQSGAATQAEILKKAVADKTVAEGLEAYRQEQAMRTRAQDLSYAMRQPANTCQTVAAQSGVSTAEQNVKAQAFRNQSRVMAKLAGNTNTVQALEATHRETNSTTCRPEEAALGVCEVNQQAEFAGLAGADQNAAFLFQAADGSPTYVASASQAHTRAADKYIDRVIAGAAPPEHLREANYGKSPQARAYIELLRRYRAVLSMSAFSLNQIREARTPQPGLGDSTMLATVPDSSFSANKHDMSMLEAAQRFVAMKFSPASIRDRARAMDGAQVLRDMAQMAAFQLWMDNQTLQHDTRSEALMALQLSLMTEQTLRPQLDAQRKVVTSASAQR